MQQHRLIYYIAAIAVMWLFLLSGIATAKGDDMFMKQLKTSIAKVRTGKTSEIRTEAAKHLFKLTRGADPKEVDDRTIDELASLLDNSDDSVRYWTARCIGNLGPRAKLVAPKLLKMLPEADRLRGSKTSASGIRFALEQMGITPPPPQCEATRD